MSEEEEEEEEDEGEGDGDDEDDRAAATAATERLGRRGAAVFFLSLTRLREARQQVSDAKIDASGFFRSRALSSLLVQSPHPRP